MRRRLSPLLAVLLLAGCDNRGRSVGAAEQPPPDGVRELTALATVLDDGDGPTLCLGAIGMSDPPVCDGPPIAGWRWGEVEHGDCLGVRLTHVGVYGTWDGEVFTLTRAPVPAEDYDGPRPPERSVRDLGTPCPAPPGGWRAPQPDRATSDALDAAGTLAEANGWTLWLDRPVDPASREHGVGEDSAGDDLLLMVVNVAVPGGPHAEATAERELREVYGGALCVSAAPRDARELRRIQAEITQRRDLWWLVAGQGQGHVDLDVVHDDGTIQAEMDQTYGVGVVRVVSALQPVDGQR